MASRFEAASVAASAGNHTAAAAEYVRIVETKDLHADYRAVARLGMAAALAEQSRTREAGAEAGQVAANEAVAACHRRTARAMLVRLVRQTGTLASANVLRCLLAEPSLAAPDRVLVLLALARHAIESGDLAEARTRYAEVIAMPEAESRQRLDARLEFGHACAAAGQHESARKVYRSLLTFADTTPVYRSLAQLAIAASFVDEKNYPAAREEYSRLSAMPDAPPHHRTEAAECLREIERREKGLPARDPTASRIVLPARPKPGVEFFVAPDGNDQNPGSQQQPFATLERARDAIRMLKRGGTLPAGGAAIVLRGGRYARREPFLLTADDSGTAASPIVYQAAPGESPVFTGGVPVRGFQPVSDPGVLARLPAASRGKVVQVDLKSQGVTDLGEMRPRGFGRSASPVLELFCDGQPMPVARFPNEGFLRVGKVVEPGAKPGTGAVFEFEGDQLKRWTQAREAWLFGYWHYLWADGTLAVASVDPQNRRIKTAQPYTYGDGVLAGMPYYVFNLLEEIDAPGEWYLDRGAGVLYFYPPSDPAKATIEVSVLARPLVELENVSHVTLRGLVFELGRGDGIVVRGGQRCLLAGCTVRRLGGDAVTIDGGMDHGLLSCDLHTLGRGGARIKGGDRKTLTPSGHFMENCHVYDFSRIDRTYTPALWTDGVGTRVAHNRFHGSPCHAARLEGNEHLVEFNEVFDVVRESDDQGGMEMFGNPTYRGVVFRWNYFHDIGGRYDWPCGQAGIRLDDAISGVLIYGNVFQRCSSALFGGVQIHGGKENVVENNVFVDCKYAVSFSGWGKARWAEFLKSDRVVQQTTREVDISKPPYSTRYPALARLAENPDVNHLWRNLAVGCGTFLARDRGIQDLAANVLRGDTDRFADRSDKRLHLAPAVCASAGLRPIPFDEIGLYPDEHHRTLPP
jgi:tetratricopeptide (TPR) repeat protein